jgi:hypothetical protein
MVITDDIPFLDWRTRLAEMKTALWQERFTKFAYSFAVFLCGAIPLTILFIAHECASTGFFIVSDLVCVSVGIKLVPVAWSRLWLIVYYYILVRYCIIIESSQRVIKGM